MSSNSQKALCRLILKAYQPILGSFYNKGIVFILHWYLLFCVIFFRDFLFALSPVEYTQFACWPIHITLTGTTTLGQSGPGSNSNEGILYLIRSSQQEVYCQMQKPPFLWGRESCIIAGDIVNLFSAPPTEWSFMQSYHIWYIYIYIYIYENSYPGKNWNQLPEFKSQTKPFAFCLAPIPLW